MILLDYVLGKHSEPAVADSHVFLYHKNSVSTRGQDGETLHCDQPPYCLKILREKRRKLSEHDILGASARVPEGERIGRLLCSHIAIVKFFAGAQFLNKILRSFMLLFHALASSVTSELN